jgi:hypothetical protein
MTDDKIVTYKTFDNSPEAHIIKSLLESNGIECFLSNENFVSLNPILSQATGGIKLNVFEKDIDKIEAIIKSENEENIGNDAKDEQENKTAFICPFCGSYNISFGNATKRKFGVFTLIVSFLLMVYPFKMRKVYHCFDCGKEFKTLS